MFEPADARVVEAMDLLSKAHTASGYGVFEYGLHHPDNLGVAFEVYRPDGTGYEWVVLRYARLKELREGLKTRAIDTKDGETIFGPTTTEVIRGGMRWDLDLEFWRSFSFAMGRVISAGDAFIGEGLQKNPQFAFPLIITHKQALAEKFQDYLLPRGPRLPQPR